jgi:acyl carrier protein
MKRMTNLEKYNAVFCEIFNVSESNLGDGFDRDAVSDWDSIRQLSLITMLEDKFEIFFDSTDILGLTSYQKGKEILRKYGVEL